MTLTNLAKLLKRRAETGTWEGKQLTPYFNRCSVQDGPLGLSAIFTRDTGYHTSGWWKNPDYERCYHLSLAFFDWAAQEYKPRDAKVTGQLLDMLYGRDKRLIWTEPPYSAEGKKKDVWHYRLFCDAGWNAIKPRGEVYGRELIEAGWQSFSDVQAALQAEEKMGTDGDVEGGWRQRIAGGT